MTKIAERAFLDGSKLVIQETHDFSEALNKSAELRSSGAVAFGESKLVGNVPMALLAQWARDAGVKWSDREAMRELLKRKMLDGEFSKFRVWEGKY